MIFFPLRFALYFTLSFFILSFSWNQKPLFMHLYSKTKPVQGQVFKGIQDTAALAWKKTKDVGLLLFSNSTPVKKDSVSTKRSGVQKENSSSKKVFLKEELDDYKEEDVKLLNSLLKE